MRPLRCVCHSVCLSICLSVYLQDYCKSDQPISLKLGVMIGATNWKNWLTFCGDPFPDTDCGSLFHFPRHGILGDLFAFLIQSPPDFHDTRRND